MYIARWHLAARFGKTDDCLAILKKWVLDVGERIGWKTGSVRVLVGAIGPADSEVELEAHFETFDELEAAWKDMRDVPYHVEYLRQLESVVAPSGSRWTVMRVVDIAPK